MVTAISLVSLVSGTALSWMAPSKPERTVLLEWCGGVLLIAGLSLIGGSLRLYC